MALMRFFFVVFVIGAMVSPSSWAELAEGKWSYMSASSIKWTPYGKDAFRQARSLQRPLFVLVYNDSCGWCRKYEKESIETGTVLQRLRKDFFPVAVDAAKQPALAKELGAFVVPTTLLLAPDGRKILKFHGFVGARDLTDILDANLYRWRKGEMPSAEFGDQTACCPVESTRLAP